MKAADANGERHPGATQGEGIVKLARSREAPLTTKPGGNGELSSLGRNRTHYLANSCGIHIIGLIWEER